MPDLSDLAAQIDAHKGETTGTFRFWDLAPVRPNDWMWRIVGARAKGKDVTIFLVDGMGEKAFDPKSSTAIVISDPGGYARSKTGGFSLKSASRVRWGDCDVRQDGKELTVSFGGKSTRAAKGKALTVETDR